MLARNPPLHICRHIRRYASKRTVLTAGTTQPSNELAERLAATQLWLPMQKGRRRSAEIAQQGDKHRVNIVSEDLCGT
jgi:hypothetical protein